ncbi:uncharacterized protein CYBJADRAFT_168690 [Cyberlindnera jadinii NRRL Y-1542]|uniref:Uncharacterized protein n=1 Tax=Cyberlindnera jadinii (strain ATCC 18201 / CBS 1600 / BCRC 20928 / JCM 3617 / NBRC 0987 / NRRL Y-1542) TaxID=983966 RepID=A0A1E4RYP2_CYBJN|nr:hypothetical protein CYBJADRAFT_168690 [Cyberlindnera jadinii NRRL Y-1542]ODV72384.1 hypothetical protein CYBJADRAFT_168690 [Cyberlindnera jadinii NRRL Y-1542]
MRVLPLATLALGALGAVIQNCVGYEPSDGPRGLYIESNEEDTSLLVYHIRDSARTNIPMVVDDDILLMEVDGFGICSQKKLSQGLCDGPVGTFTVKVMDGEKPQSAILNQRLMKGENVTYQIHEQGIFCGILYQEAESVKGLYVQEIHSYGYLSLAGHAEAKVFQLLIALLFITQLVLIWTFRGDKKKYIGTIFQDICVLLSLKVLEITWNNLILSLWNFYPRLSLFKVFDFYIAVQFLFTIGSYIVYYKLSSGVYGYGKPDRERLSIQPAFKKCLVAQGVSYIILSFHPLLEKLAHFYVVQAIQIIASLVSAFIWIPMFYIMYKNSKMTYNEIVDPIFARKYLLSRRALIFIPISLGLISTVGTMVVMAAATNSSQKTGDIGKDFKENFTTMLEVSTKQNMWYVLLSHLNDFSMLVVQWVLLLIWNPKTIDPSEFEDVHANQLNEGNGKLQL